MAANRLLQIITACALSFAATRTVCAVQVDCSIKLWKVNTSSTSHYSSVESYHCTPQMPEVSVLAAFHHRWNKCPLSETNPSDSCGPVDPAPYDNRSHVAVVPCTNSCPLEEKAQNLGQANYPVFITWDSYNCSANLDLQRESSNNGSSFPLLVTEENGQQLLLYSRDPNYVVDINIEYDGTAALIGLVIVSLMLFFLCCCCSFIWLRMCWRLACRRHDSRRRNYSISKRTLNRLAVKCKYKAGQSMNETCAICLEEFSEGEQVRELPCLHVYHRGCVETWLKDYKHTCPLCKGSITAKRKKRAAASKAERAPLLADQEACVSYSAVHDGRGDKEESNSGNEPVAITVRALQDAEAGLNSGSLY